MADEQKFAPPLSNIVVRTMETDVEALRSGGGELPPQPIPEAPAAAPEASFLNPTPTQPMNEASLPPSPPPIEPVHAGPPPAGGPSGGAKFQAKPLIFALGGVGALLALGALGYFVVFPIVKNAFFPPIPSPSPSPVVTFTPSPSVEVTPTPVVENPLLVLQRPATSTKELTLSAKTAPVLTAALIDESKISEATSTLKVLSITFNDNFLTAQEMFSLLFPNAPSGIMETLDTRYAIYLFYPKPDAPALGAMFSIKPEATTTKTLFASWENTLPTDAAAFFLGKPAGTIVGTFKDGTFSNVPLRYANLTSGAAIDYAVTQNVFLFTTHKDSMFEAIRKLQGL